MHENLILTPSVSDDCLEAKPRFLKPAPNIKAFGDHMFALCNRDVLPRYSDLDLMDIYRLAPYVTVLDVVSEARRLRVRFAGTGVVHMFECETTGMYMDEIDIGDHREQLLAAYDLTITSRTAQWTMAHVNLGEDAEVLSVMSTEDSHRHFAYERLAFPLCAADGAVTHIVAAMARHALSSAKEQFCSQNVTRDEWLEFVQYPVQARCA